MKLKDFEQYLNYEFSSGCYTGEDYKSFERKYINYLKSICKENGWELVNVGKSHYQFSAFLRTVATMCICQFQMFVSLKTNGTTIF